MDYQEVQYAHENWVARLVMLVIFPGWLFAIYGFVQQIFLGETFGDNPSSDGELIFFTAFSTIIFLGVLVLLVFSRLETQVLDEGIALSYLPFLKRRVYHWDELQSAEIRKYNPIRDYGGWGWRRGWGKKGWVYNVSGNKGLQLVFKDGRRILIGTQRPDELEQAVQMARPRR